MTAQLQILRYLYAGLRLTDKAVTAPNHKVVQAVRQSTITDLRTRGWIEPDPARAGYYQLTTEGRARALVKQRVEDFLSDLSNHSTT